MLKTIPISQLKIGMHIHAFKGSWIDHPFWKTKFTLEDAEDLRKLQTSGIKKVVINVPKGLDVIISQPQEALLNQNRSLPAIKKESEPAPEVGRLSAAQEYAQATRTINASRKAITSMFKDVRMGKVINIKQLAPLVADISASISRSGSALISLARLKTKDDYTYMHSVAVCGLMIALSRQLNLSEAETKQAGLAGLLHDIGKAAIPNAVLNKPGALTDDEFILVKMHPQNGHQLLLEAGVVDEVALDVCLHHHEKVDGTGYPHQLKGEQISLFARMGAICDVYDAVTSNRPYKEGWDPAVSLHRMALWKGHFDEKIFKAFVKSLGIYPVGSTIKLTSGRLAIVVDQNPESLLSPVVKVFFSTKSKSKMPVTLIDLSLADEHDVIEGYEDPEAWGVKNVDEVWSGFKA